MDAILNSYEGNYHPLLKLAGDEPGQSNTLQGTGKIGRDRLRDLENIDPIIQQGARSGRCSREIEEIRQKGSDDTLDGDEIVLQKQDDDGGGNSGEPYLVDDGESLLVAGIHQRTDAIPKSGPDRGIYSSSVSEGMYIGDIESAFNLKVY